MRNQYVVYCDAVGYRFCNDTGKRFRLESEAIHTVFRLRRAGHRAWMETIHWSDPK